MTWSIPSPIALPGTAAPPSMALAAIPAAGPPGIEYVFWVAADGTIQLSRFPGLDPGGAAVRVYTSFALTSEPPPPAQRPVRGTSRLAAVGTEDLFWVVWVGADGVVRIRPFDAMAISPIGPVAELGSARADSALAAAQTRPWRTVAWVTSDARLGVAQIKGDASRRDAVLGEPGSVRPDTPIALATKASLAHLLWVTANGTLVASSRLNVGDSPSWSLPATISDAAGVPAEVAHGDTLAVVEVPETAKAIWLEPTGELRHATFGTDAWGSAEPLIAAGRARVNGPVRALVDSDVVEVLFATPDGGVAIAAPSFPPFAEVRLAGPTGGGLAALSVGSLGGAGRAAAWATADGSILHTRTRVESFGPTAAGPLPGPLAVVGDVRAAPASARCDLRLRHATAADAVWVRPDGALALLSGRDIVTAFLATIPLGWRWRAGAVARPGLVRTSPPGAVARLSRDPTGFSLLWVQPDGSVRAITFDGSDLVESPSWRLPVDVAPPGSAAADRPAVAATTGPPEASPGEEWAFWLRPGGLIGAARRDAAEPNWRAQASPAGSARADSTLLAGTMAGLVRLVWIGPDGVPVLASKAPASDWVLTPAPPGKREFTLSSGSRLVAGAADASLTRAAWIDIDGAVRAASMDGGVWGDAAQRSDPGVVDASSLAWLQGEAALAWVLPDGTVVVEAQDDPRLMTGPGAARAVLGSVPRREGGTVVLVVMPDGHLGLLQRGP